MTMQKLFLRYLKKKSLKGGLMSQENKVVGRQTLHMGPHILRKTQVSIWEEYARQIRR